MHKGIIPLHDSSSFKMSKIVFNYLLLLVLVDFLHL